METYNIIPGCTELHYVDVIHFPIGPLNSTPLPPPLFYIMMCHISMRLLLVLGSLQGSLVDQYNVDVFLPYSQGSSSPSFACI